MSPVGKAAHLL